MDNTQGFFMELKKLNTSLLLLINILVFIAILCLLKILFSGIKKIEWGNVADLTSAICNIMIASTALYAAFVANNWFVQNKKLKSLSTSHQLAMKFEMQLWEINSRLYNDTLVRASIKKDIKDSRKLTEELKSKVEAEIKKQLTNDLEELANLYTTKSMLTRFDIHLSDRFEKLFENILRSRKSYLDSQYSYLAVICNNIDSPTHADVVTATENLENCKTELASLFQLNLCETNINDDYYFR